MTDLISREKAIKAISCDITIIGKRNAEVVCETMEKFVDTIKALPSEQKTGRWVEKEDVNGDVYYDCSVCGESWTTIEGTPKDNDMNYCPSCGADMREAEE